MNWPHFILWITGVYLLYYLLLILFDVSVNKRPSLKTELRELTFSENVIPQQVEHLPDKAPEQSRAQTSIIGSGGVTLKDLFGLCREEAIIYTRPVSF